MVDPIGIVRAEVHVTPAPRYALLLALSFLGAQLIVADAGTVARPEFSEDERR
jgi:hypothetical protein